MVKQTRDIANADTRALAHTMRVRHQVDDPDRS